MKHLSLGQVLSPRSFLMVFEEESFFRLKSGSWEIGGGCHEETFYD